MKLSVKAVVFGATLAGMFLSGCIGEKESNNTLSEAKLNNHYATKLANGFQGAGSVSSSDAIDTWVLDINSYGPGTYGLVSHQIDVGVDGPACIRVSVARCTKMAKGQCSTFSSKPESEEICGPKGGKTFYVQGDILGNDYKNVLPKSVVVQHLSGPQANYGFTITSKKH